MPRFFMRLLCTPRLFVPRFLLPWLFSLGLFCPALLLALRLERVDAPLLFYDRGRHGCLLVARAIAAIAVTSAAIAPAAPVLFAFVLGWAWLLPLGRQLMKLRRIALHGSLHRL